MTIFLSSAPDGAVFAMDIKHKLRSPRFWAVYAIGLYTYCLPAFQTAIHFQSWRVFINAIRVYILYPDFAFAAAALFLITLFDIHPRR